jgi:hypothetical protein
MKKVKTKTKVQLTQEQQFFAAENKADTLVGAVLQNPTAAVRALGPLETIRIGCGITKTKAEGKP